MKIKSSLIVKNKKATFNYTIVEKVEAGIVLKGTEVKSLRAGKVNISDSYARVSNEEVFMLNASISRFDQGNVFNVDPGRERKLLLHKAEINRIMGKIKEKGFTLIPLNMHWKGNIVKVELGLCKSKNTVDKRHTIKKREQDREIGRALSDRY